MMWCPARERVKKQPAEAKTAAPHAGRLSGGRTAYRADFHRGAQAFADVKEHVVP